MGDTATRAAARSAVFPIRSGKRRGSRSKSQAVSHGSRTETSDAIVRGLKEIEPQDRPNAIIVHLAFQAMVGDRLRHAGVGLWAGVVALRRRRLPDSRWFLRAAVAAGPAAFLAIEAGWIVTEVGRQPWIMQGVMRTSEAVTSRPGIGWHLSGTLPSTWLLAAASHLPPAPPLEAPEEPPRRRGSRSGVSLEATTSRIVVAGPHVYVLLAGADFGGGVWDLFASGVRGGTADADRGTQSARSGRPTTSG